MLAGPRGVLGDDRVVGSRHRHGVDVVPRKQVAVVEVRRRGRVASAQLAEHLRRDVAETTELEHRELVEERQVHHLGDPAAADDADADSGHATTRSITADVRSRSPRPEPGTSADTHPA